MNTQANKSRYLPRLIVGIAVILCSTAGIAGIMGWRPVPTGGSGDIPGPGGFPVASDTRVAVSPQAESEPRTRGRCAECGVVVSMREIDVRDEGGDGDASGGAVTGNGEEPALASARRYEITIRMSDRSSRVIRSASAASWRPGEHVVVIDGAKPSGR